MKFLVKFVSFFCISFFILTIRVENQPLFNYLDSFLTPITSKYIEISEKEIKIGLTYIKSKAGTIFKNASVDKIQNKLSAPKRDRYGHQTYGDQEKKEMLNRLTNALQEHN